MQKKVTKSEKFIEEMRRNPRQVFGSGQEIRIGKEGYFAPCLAFHETSWMEQSVKSVQLRRFYARQETNR